jgi:dipeptidyl-peptidase 4
MSAPAKNHGPFTFCLYLLLSFALGALPAVAQEGGTETQVKKVADQGENETVDASETELTLENLYPEKGMFGPSARSAAFSADGRFGAWLYRPYLERRHGSDLYIMDMESGKIRRVTSVSVMAPFQADTMKVKKDRIKKVKAKGKKKEGEDESDKGKSEVDKDQQGKDVKKGDGKKPDIDDLLGNKVDEDDFEDEDAPRYSGVSSFEWSPTGNEMLFLSGGDIYRLTVGEKDFERLSKTRARERSVQYLPDGKGYTLRQDEALLRVTFGTHFVEQLDPKLPSGQSLRSYKISPDGKKMVLLASTGSRFGGGGRTVNIATYEDRFMKVREVQRTVSDDPIPPSTTTVYLYEFPEPALDNGKLVKVYAHKVSGPRDALATPAWSPDSSKVAFSVFEQTSGHVNILQAEFPKEEKPKAKDKDGDEGKAKDKGEKGAKGKKSDGDSGKKKDQDKKKKQGERHVGGPMDEGGDKSKDDEFKENPARVVYRFLHHGGPTTPRMIKPEYLADSRRMIFLTEQAGFRHLFVLDPVYESLEQFTRGNYEVYPLDMPKHRKFMFVTSTKEDASRLDVYKLDLSDASMTRLTPEVGSYSRAAVSPDGKRVLATFASYGSLRELVLVDVEAGTQKALTDSHPKKVAAFTSAKPEFFTYENRHGQLIHGNLFKPEGWKKEDKRPLLIYVYGGPLGTSKQVTQGSYSGSGYFFAWYMAQKYGYVTCTIDPRGMSGYGALFEKANYEQAGIPQVEDLTDGVKYLVENLGVDPERVGIHGWSFGGFQTQMCLYTEPDVFAVGIAGAGPTEWENYNSWYSTGTIGPSREGQTDLKKYSLLPLAKNLKGKLLLIHGMEDPNVLYQDTVRVYAELLDAGKETNVELFLDPSGGHGLGGHVKSLGRYRKYEDFLLRTLGKGPVPEKPVAPEPTKEKSAD